MKRFRLYAQTPRGADMQFNLLCSSVDPQRLHVTQGQVQRLRRVHRLDARGVDQCRWHDLLGREWVLYNALHSGALILMPKWERDSTPRPVAVSPPAVTVQTEDPAAGPNPCHTYLVSICDMCLDGRGPSCNNGWCAFCRHSMDDKLGEALRAARDLFTKHIPAACAWDKEVA